MTLVDRFVCRREGHIPSLTLTKVSGIEIESYITSCARCGKVYETQAAPKQDGEASEAAKGTVI